MADSFSKKENIKKKAKKHQDKQMRREERKTQNNKGKSFDEMLIYIDENGNFTDIPPHLQERNADTPNKKSATKDEHGFFTGIVTYMSEKGYGFITEDETKENVFFHQQQQREPIKKNDRVSYTKESSVKGHRAIDIEIKK
ncbi:MAG TPA: cold shock domain-containing protein [Flavobacterium sp.]|nr:cold shock domain-containing protein [Flavobacterium sp.]